MTDFYRCSSTPHKTYYYSPVVCLQNANFAHNTGEKRFEMYKVGCKRVSAVNNYSRWGIMGSRNMKMQIFYHNGSGYLG